MLFNHENVLFIYITASGSGHLEIAEKKFKKGTALTLFLNLFYPIFVAGK
jgi:hypothetical protein